MKECMNKTDCILTMDGETVIFRYDGAELRFHVSCPVFKIDGKTYTSETTASKLTQGENKINCLFRVACESAFLDVTVNYSLTTHDHILRKWAEITPSGFSDGVMLEEITVDCVNFSEKPEYRNLGDTISNYPYYFKDKFIALEFPYAVSTVNDHTVSLGHKPSHVLINGELYKTKNVIYGLCGGMNITERFHKYVEANRPHTNKVQTNYNSWWSLPFPYSEDQVLSLMSTFKENLFDKYGIAFDTFAIDMGWSKRDAVWEINTELFPEGFDNIMKMANSMGSNLGLWISPSNVYSPNSFDNITAKEDAYEFIKHSGYGGTSAMCLAGKKYQSKLKAQLCEYVSKYHIMHIKFDGIVTVCSETDHGHITDGGERELIAEGMIDIFRELNKIQPGIWLESTCFGYNASPFWLNYCSSVLGTYGDDSPNGILPCPVYRESVTSGRDFYNLHGAERLSTEIKYQELLGVIHQSDDDFTNDLINVIMRGNSYIPFYFNPMKNMTAERWKRLAAVLKLLKDNSDIFENTEILRPGNLKNLSENALMSQNKMQGDVYGYVHRLKNKTVVLLRNPYIEKSSYSLKIDECKNRSITSLYPEVRNYAAFNHDGIAEITLAPYETLLLVVGETVNDAPDADTIIYNSLSLISADVSKSMAEINTLYTVKSKIISESDQAELLFLIEDTKLVHVPSDLVIKTDGIINEPLIINNNQGFTATGIAPVEFWEFAVVPLNSGMHEIEFTFSLSQTGSASVKIYTAASKAGSAVQKNSPLPQPEKIYTDSVMIAKIL
ncbi:MAG: alpha-galactosidase [Eubacteriales bacterium]